MLENAVTRREGIEQPLGHPHRIGRGAQIIDQNQELVAAEATDQVGSDLIRGLVPDSEGRFQTARNLAQQLIPGIVAERIVDDLEAIEVKKQHGAVRLAARCVPARAPPPGAA